ncbi:MAG: hypothetical protein INR71_15050, partial [Terriglobus roseus]|nr:hypothetical protein [Terriglobus roseus]
MVFIQNGQLRDNLQAGLEKEEFTRRVMAAIGVADGQEAQQLPTASQTEEHEAARPAQDEAISESRSSQTTKDTASDSQQPQASSSTAPTTNTNENPPSYETSNLQAMFPDRESRLEASHRTHQAAEAARLAAARARSNPQPSSTTPTSSSQTPPQRARNDYAAQQRARLAAAKAERERVLAAIENDKAERRERERARRAAVEATQSSLAPSSSLPVSDNVAAGGSRRAGLAGTANLQVRLASGRTLRGRFPATATLAREVREWVDAAVVEDAAEQGQRVEAYVFRVILNPLPSRTVEVAEEGQSLLDLGLLPSATLVLVSVQGGAEAYAGNGGGLVDMAYGAASGAYGLVSGTVGAVTGRLGGLVGWGAGVAPAEQRQDAVDNRDAGRTLDGTGDDSKASSSASGIRVRTLADQRADASGKEGETWYNGNQVRP